MLTLQELLDLKLRSYVVVFKIMDNTEIHIMLWSVDVTEIKHFMAFCHRADDGITRIQF